MLTKRQTAYKFTPLTATNVNEGFMGYNLKPLSVMKNVVGLQTDDAGNVGQNSSAHVACVVGLQTDAVVVTETRFTKDPKR